MKKYFIVHSPNAGVYLTTATQAENNDRQLVSNYADEMIYGETGSILKREGSWYYILSEYGYAGYIRKIDIDLLDQEQLAGWTFGPLVIVKRNVDVLTIPSVHGFCLITLPIGAVLKLTGIQKDGWTEVRLTDNRTGFVPDGSYEEKRYDSYLLNEDQKVLLAEQNIDSTIKYKQQGGCDKFTLMPVLNKWFEGDENVFRRTLVETAKSYLVTQYRWGGRSGFGIDCSGLVQAVYLRCGVAVFRDAVITDGYPLKKLDLDLSRQKDILSHADEAGIRPGDTLYSPGHVMMYIGNNEFIHSTGKAGVCQVVVNSLDPSADNYREDLAHTIYAVAGLRL